VWAGDLTVRQSEESSIDELRKLIDWGAPLIPMRLLTPEVAPDDTVDLDELGESWRAALKPGAAVRGRVLATPAGIRAALSARVRAAVVHHRLPALIACLLPSSESDQAQPEVAEAATRISELTLLRLLALKGRASEDILADALGADSATGRYGPLCELGLCSKGDNGLRLTNAGRTRLAHLLAEERARVDPAAMLAAYEDFCVLNSELKQIMTAWQVRSDGMANDHSDAGYDDAVLRRLADLHDRAIPLMRRLAQLAPRLASYQTRLSRAAARLAAGDHSYVAKIVHDSYHTVWFELHEELIALIGLTRDALARGQIRS
jgi:hypothetical protein